MPPRTIVVVEDEPPIAAAIADRLRSEGFRVEIAADGLTGVELCRTTKPDLVVLDLMLPGLDGLEVCRRVPAGRAGSGGVRTAPAPGDAPPLGVAAGAPDHPPKPPSP